MESTMKFVALGVTAVLTIFGIIAQEYANERHHKFTVLGKGAIGFAIVAFAVGAYLQIKEIQENETKRSAAEAATRQQLSEIRRAVYAMTGMRVAFAIAYPLPTDGTSTYRQRLAGIAKGHQADPKQRDIPGSRAVWLDPSGGLRGIVFFGTSALAPRPSSEVDEATTVDLSEVTLDFFVRPTPEAKARNGVADRGGDLTLKVDADAHRDWLTEAYLLQKDELMVWTPLLDMRDFKNAELRAVQDLVSARLAITLSNGTSQRLQVGRERYLGKNNPANIASMSSGARLMWVRLQLKDWGDICVTEEQLTRIDDHTALPRFVVDLPASLDRLRELYGNQNCDIRY